MGGAGSGIAYDEADLHRIAGSGLQASPTTEVLLEESIIGWKEYELELMRDRSDNVVVVCSIENLDPMGVHTGDSITVAPALTLTDREYQRMRDVGIDIIRAVGVDTGGCNIQFAINPDDGRLIVIEMNPRVSRSSALASKATGFPIAKIAARLAIGYTLDEIPNDITRETPASFEPTLDYIVVKVPRFAFEKFPHADATLTTTMKSVGEAMAIGRNFPEALQKALRSLEKPDAVFSWPASRADVDVDALLAAMRVPRDGRLSEVQLALWAGAGIDAVHEASNIDPWFLDQICQINERADEVRAAESLDHRTLMRAKRFGFSDRQLGELRGLREHEVRELRHELGVRPVYKTVDTCAAEFAAQTPYHYSSYDEETEVVPSDRDKVIILGSGPNRIGQGIEFDYSCVHAALTLRDAGYETIMVNCNPETVSTDYDTSDRLYFEPLTLEDVLEVVHAEQQAGHLVGVIVQLGGQTPLGLAQRLKDAGVPIIGTSPESIHLAEERGAFGRVLAEAGLIAPKHGTARTFDEAQAIAADVGYPVLVRPSYVLGGRGMEIVYDDAMLADYLDRSTHINAEHPVLVDRFLDDAVEIDVDAIYDGEELYLAGVMEHIEEAGIHSGDSACALPPITLGVEDIDRIRGRPSRSPGASACAACSTCSTRWPATCSTSSRPTRVRRARCRSSPRRRRCRSPRRPPASWWGRPSPTCAPRGSSRRRATAARCRTGPRSPSRRPCCRSAASTASTPCSVPRCARPARSWASTTPSASPSPSRRRRRTPADCPRRARRSSPSPAATSAAAIFPIKRLADLGFRILATAGTAAVLRRNGVPVEELRKQHEGRGPNGEPTTVDAIMAGDIQLIVNTPYGVGPRLDGYEIRTAAVIKGVACITTVQGLAAAVQGIDSLQHDEPTVRSLQEHAAALAVLRAEQDL